MIAPNLRPGSHAAPIVKEWNRVFGDRFVTARDVTDAARTDAGLFAALYPVAYAGGGALNPRRLAHWLGVRWWASIDAFCIVPGGPRHRNGAYTYQARVVTPPGWTPEDWRNFGMEAFQ